jgi:hypothetical protein
MTYDPQVDDYVIWKRPNGDIDEGWIYFKGEKIPKKRGFNETPQYLTLEVYAYDKPDFQYSSGKTMLHKKVHVLLLCYAHDWKDLEYVKNRRDQSVEDHYIRLAKLKRKENKEDDISLMYKSQDRPLDIDSYGTIPPRY